MPALVDKCIVFVYLFQMLLIDMSGIWIYAVSRVCMAGQPSGRGPPRVCPCLADRLVGRVVKASTSRAEGPGFESRLRRDFFGVESYQ